MTSKQVNSFSIASDRLKVDIDQPGQYGGVRFDWTGLVRQVTLLDGGHTFCVPESYTVGAGTGGIGLCNEFIMDAPFGYPEAMEGGQFPKIGVGILTRQAQAGYGISDLYPVEPFGVEIERQEDQVRFRTEVISCNGYAFVLEKTLTIRGTELTLDYKLYNNGEKPIEAREYVHNFVAIDGQSIGPDYVLRFPEELNLEYEPAPELKRDIHIEGNKISWEPVNGTFFNIYVPEGSNVPFYWELTNTKSGVGMRESGSEIPVSYALWGQSHVVSPEVFVSINVQPNQSQAWSRTFEFYKDQR